MSRLVGIPMWLTGVSARALPATTTSSLPVHDLLRGPMTAAGAAGPPPILLFTLGMSTYLICGTTNRSDHGGDQVMKAAVLRGPATLIYADVDEPDVEPGSVLVRVGAVSICGSDLLRVFGGTAHSYPLILGHECAGVVAEVGAGVPVDLVGARVAVVPLVPCMQCASCRRGLYSACARYSFIGSRRAGGFADYVVAPLRNAMPLPDALDIEIGAILEPATIALHALERGGIKSGDRVAILGSGSVGLCAVQWARLCGAAHIIATDVVAENLELARALGADTTIDGAHEDVVAQVMGLTGDGVDVALEVAGTPATLRQAVAATRPRGVVILIGNQAGDTALPVTVIDGVMRRELDVRGAWMSYAAPFPGHEWTETLAAAERGDLRLREMISHRFPLSEVPDVFKRIHDHALPHRKIILTP